jgi:hypothetical protein
MQENMDSTVLIKEKKQQIGGFKVIQRGNVIETVNNLNQVFHFIDLSYTQAGIMYQGWVGFRTTEQIKEILNGHFMELYKVYKCQSMLQDLSQMSGSFSEVNDWYAFDFMPQLKSLGLKNNAIVLPKDIFAQLAMRDWMRKMNTFNNGCFATLSEAINWLAVQ